MNTLFSVICIIVSWGLSFAGIKMLSKKSIVRSVIYSGVLVLILNVVMVTAMSAYMRRLFNLFAMSIGFQIKWWACIFIGVIFIPLIICNMKTVTKQSVLSVLKKSTVFVVCMEIVCVLVIPSTLFVSNINEFGLYFYQIIPYLLICLVAVYILVEGAIILVCNPQNVRIVNVLLVVLTVCMYLQSNFVNPILPSMDGAAVDWSIYSKDNILSVTIWCVVLLVCVVLLAGLKDRFVRVAKYVMLFLAAVQFVTLVSVVITTPLKEEAQLGFSKEDEFTLGENKNVVIFVLDTLQADVMQKYLDSEQYNGQFGDFEVYDNLVGGGAPTELGIPLLLTGMEYDGMQNLNQYYEDAWANSPLYDYQEAGIDVRLFTDWLSARNVPIDISNNTIAGVGRKVVNKPQFIVKFYQLAGIYMAPQPLKKYMWLSTEELLTPIENKDMAESAYQFRDAAFHDEMVQNGDLDITYDNTFRLYHLWGAHAPFFIDADMNALDGNGGCEDDAVIGCMKIVAEYMQKMKEKNVYDNSLIIVMADHGKGEDYNIETNPCCLIKWPNECKNLEINHSPVMFRNLIASYNEYLLDDSYGRGARMCDIDDNSEVQRLHTFNFIITNRTVHKERNDGITDVAGDHMRAIVNGDAAGVTQDYDLWDPTQINVIETKIGENFELNSGFERVFAEENGIWLSNEFTMYPIIAEYDNKQNVVLNLTVDNIMGESQKVYVYANGTKIGEEVIDSTQLGKSYAYIVPRDCIKDNACVIRILCPQALTDRQIGDGDGTTPKSIAIEKISFEYSE